MSAKPSKSQGGKPVETANPKPGRRGVWRRLALVGALVVVMLIILKVFGPDGATYEEYQQLKVGMSRTEVEDIVGQGDYWYHMEGEYQVASWVNKDRTYIQTVFDANDVLVDKSWKIGWKGDGDTESSLYDE